MSLLTPSRIGDDKDTLSQRDVQDNAYSSYLLENYYKSDTDMRKTIEFATQNVAMNYCSPGGNQCGMNGCKVEDNSKLLLGAVQTHSKCRFALAQRPFMTVPYLGKGAYNPDTESMLQQTDTFSNNKKSVNTLSEKCYVTQYPLIPSIQDTITNPKFLVEEGARGGESTRKTNIATK